MYFERNGSKLGIHAGKIRFAELEVNDRFQSNGHRRAKNLAIYVKVFNLARPTYPTYGASVSIEEARKLLQDMELETTLFDQICKDQGWGVIQDIKDQTRMF